MPNANRCDRFIARQAVFIAAVTALLLMISPVLEPGFEPFEVERAYQNGFSIQNNPGLDRAGGRFGGGLEGF